MNMIYWVYIIIWEELPSLKYHLVTSILSVFSKLLSYNLLFSNLIIQTSEPAAGPNGFSIALTEFYMKITMWCHLFLYDCNNNLYLYIAFIRASLVAQITWLSSWVKKVPWRRKWLPIPVFLPGDFHGQRSLVGYSPWGCKELDMTEQLSLHFPLAFINSSFCFPQM